MLCFALLRGLRSKIVESNISVAPSLMFTVVGITNYKVGKNLKIRKNVVISGTISGGKDCRPPINYW